MFPKYNQQVHTVHINNSKTQRLKNLNDSHELRLNFVDQIKKYINEWNEIYACEKRREFSVKSNHLRFCGKLIENVVIQLKMNFKRDLCWLSAAVANKILFLFQ